MWLAQEPEPLQLVKGSDGRLYWQQSPPSSVPPETSREQPSALCSVPPQPSREQQNASSELPLHSSREEMRASFEEAQRETRRLSQMLSPGGGLGSFAPSVLGSSGSTALPAQALMSGGPFLAASREQYVDASSGWAPLPMQIADSGGPSWDARREQDAQDTASQAMPSADVAQTLSRIQSILVAPAVSGQPDRASLVANNPWQTAGQGDRAFEVGENPRQVASQERQDPLRQQLLEVGSSFRDLDMVVQEDLRRRKELEQIRSQEIVVSLSKMAKTLSIETARRNKQHDSLRENVDSLLESMVTTVQSRILERFQQLSDSLQSLTDRCTTLELGIQQFKGELPSKLQVQTNTLRQNIYRVAQDLASDRKNREKQDARLLHDVEEAENKLDVLVQQELAQQDRETEGVQLLIEEAASSQSRANAEQQARITTRLEELKEQLRLEEQARDNADDHVLQAINSFAVAMHRSLKNSNS